jgi:hypothetical protein
MGKSDEENRQMQKGKKSRKMNINKWEKENA